MSFDEQPDGDIHGECAAEIHRLELALRIKAEEHDCCAKDLLLWRTSYESACTQNVHLCEKIDDCRPFLQEGESPSEGLARLRSKITEVFGRWTLFMDAQKEALTEGGKTISIDRYKQIMAGLGMPNSQSLLCALQQVANEVGQKYSADAIDLEDAAEKARARAMLNELKWQRVSHDKEALQDQIDDCGPYLKEGETVADALKRLSERKTVRSLCEAYEACKPFLKDGEAPAEGLARNRADIVMLMGKLGAEKMRSAKLRTDLDKIAQTTGSDDPCRQFLKDGETAADALNRLEHSESFYRRRCEALQAWQSSMRDPERVIVCDVLANGFTLDQPFAGDRYAGLRPAAPTTKETA